MAREFLITGLVCLLCMSQAFGAPAYYGGLSPYYYSRTCSRFLSIVGTQTNQTLVADPTLAASVLRLLFHDCFVDGCDGSVLLDSIIGPPAVPAEKDGAPNAGSLRGFELVDTIKSQLEIACPGVVSCADIVVAMASYATVKLRGPYISFSYGRRDGRVSLSDNSLTLPAPFNNVSTLISKFAAKGMTIQDMVTLSGAHSVGRAHCVAITARLYNFDGLGNPDPKLNAAYLAKLRAACPQNSPGTFVNMDPNTDFILDSNYYQLVNSGRGLFSSDASLLDDSRTARLVRLDQFEALFGIEFVNSMIKMGNIGILTGTQGEVRRNCRVVN